MKFIVTKYFNGLDETADFEVQNRNEPKQYVFIKFTPDIYRKIRRHEQKVLGDEDIAFIAIHAYGVFFLDETTIDYSSTDDVYLFNKLIEQIRQYDESELEEGVIFYSNEEIDEVVLESFSLNESALLNITQDGVVFFSDSINKRSYYLQKNKFSEKR